MPHLLLANRVLAASVRAPQRRRLRDWEPRGACAARQHGEVRTGADSGRSCCSPSAATAMVEQTSVASVAR
jgi:hypothetical protein